MKTTSQYGLHEVKLLSGYFNMNLNRLEAEWSIWRDGMILKKKGSKFDLDVQATISYFLEKEQMSSFFTNLAILAKITLCIPLTSVDCERGFSCMNRIMTDSRNRLLPETLDQLMRISL